jgi:hypothetical protein
LPSVSLIVKKKSFCFITPIVKLHVFYPIEKHFEQSQLLPGTYQTSRQF